MSMRLLVVGSVSMTPWGADQLVRLAEQAGVRGLGLIGLDTAGRLAGPGVTSGENALYDEVVAVDVDDPAACVDAVVGRTDVAAVATIRELSVAAVAAVAAALGLRGNDPTVVERIRHKDRCRAWLREHGFAQPSTRLCASIQDAIAFVGETPGPWIVKPRDGLASIGVSLVAEPTALPTAIARVGPGRPFLVETFVDGEELSAEGVMLEGVPTVLALTRKLVGAGPGVIGDGFVETGHRQPALLDAEIAERAHDAVVRALTAVGVTCGIFHVEFWLTADGIVLGELHVRGGGDFIHLLVEATHPETSLFGLLIDDLLGRPAGPVGKAVGAAGATFFTLPPGTITAITGWEAIRAHARVIACDLQVGVGDTVAPATGSYDRPAVVVVTAPTLADVEALTDELEAALVVSVR